VRPVDAPDFVPDASPRSPEELLSEGLQRLGFVGREDLERGLSRHIREIEAWNPSAGLVKATGAELVVRHALDSLAGAPAFASLPAGSVVLDLGSGAGFPGVPLALARPDLSFQLLERSSKRCTFLEHCVAVLHLGNTGVFVGDARSYRGRADAVTFRAVSALTPEFLRSSGILALAPLVVAYKGTMVRTGAELCAVRELYASVEVVPIEVPFLRGERTLVVLRR